MKPKVKLIYICLLSNRHEVDGMSWSEILLERLKDEVEET